MAGVMLRKWELDHRMESKFKNLRGGVASGTAAITGRDGSTSTKSAIQNSLKSSVRYLIASVSSCTPSPTAPKSYKCYINAELAPKIENKTNLDISEDGVGFITIEGRRSLVFDALHPKRIIHTRSSSTHRGGTCRTKPRDGAGQGEHDARQVKGGEKHKGQLVSPRLLLEVL